MSDSNNYRPKHARTHQPKHAAPGSISTNTSVLTGILALGCLVSIGLMSISSKPPSSAEEDDKPIPVQYDAAGSDRALFQRAERHAARSSTRAAPPTNQAVPLSIAVPPETKGPRKVDPVGNLSQQQMDHAAVIVYVGQEEGLSKRALIIAIATALQESTLRNLANHAHPSSLDLPNDGTGRDHDSVGLFQQRPSQGWGTVAELMDPATSAKKFYSSLQRVNGWQDMSVTQAAQRVQRSAYPNAYAKHESLARDIVAALTD